MLTTQPYFHRTRVSFNRQVRWKLRITEEAATLIITRSAGRGSRLTVKLTSLFDPALYYPHPVPSHPRHVPEAFVDRAFGVALHFGWHPDATSGTFTLRHAHGVFIPFRGAAPPLPQPQPLDKNAQELIRILSTNTLPPPGNTREFFKEVANHQISDALKIGDWTAAFLWAERCLQVLGNAALHMDGVRNLRARMILLFGHQAGHFVLDGKELTEPFFEQLIWTPEEAERVAKESVTLDEHETINQLIKVRQKLQRLQLIAHLLPAAEQRRLEPWFSVEPDIQPKCGV